MTEETQRRARKHVKILLGILLAYGAVGITTTAVQAQSELTLDNFESRFRSNPFGKDIVPEPFNCKSGTVVVCVSVVRSGSVKADITVRGNPTTRALTKVGIMISHPKLARDRAESARISILYALLMVKIATTLNPELSEDEAIDKMAQLQKKAPTGSTTTCRSAHGNTEPRMASSS